MAIFWIAAVVVGVALFVGALMVGAGAALESTSREASTLKAKGAGRYTQLIGYKNG